MLDSHKVFLYDRIKETSFTLGTSNFTLNGAADGFSSFGSVYSNGENVFYAATDGTFYEVGSGVYVTGVQNSLTRFPFRSSNNNQIVSFGEGVKEVFVTYPATNSVFSASGLQGQSQPQSSGLAFWSSSHILNYDPNIVWNSELSRLGIKKSAPVFAIDIGGDAPESIIRSSGLFVKSSGIFFPSGNNGDASYFGGRQLVHYEPNSLNFLTGVDQVFELSGVSKNNILFKQQNAGLVFAGPASGCTPPCSPDYPTFRPLLVEDIHDLNASVIDNGGGVSLYQRLGVNTNRLDGNITSYTNQNDPNAVSGLLKASYVASGLYGGGLTLVDTVLSNPSGQYGYGIYTTESGVNLSFNSFNMASGITQSVLTLKSNGVAASAVMDFYGQKLRIRNSKTPVSSSDVGDAGDICWDSTYIYVCVATNTWKRAFISTW
jgi:hypothetical protein